MCSCLNLILQRITEATRGASFMEKVLLNQFFIQVYVTEGELRGVARRRIPQLARLSTQLSHPRTWPPVFPPFLLVAPAGNQRLPSLNFKKRFWALRDLVGSTRCGVWTPYRRSTSHHSTNK